jgi:hypothetical protein
MSPINRRKFKHGMIALPIIAASILLAAPAAQTRGGFGFSLGIPLVVPPPVVAAPPPPVVLGPPAYYAPPPPYYYPPPPAYYALPPGHYYAPAPGYGFFWYDHFGHRHWHR